MESGNACTKPQRGHTQKRIPTFLEGNQNILRDHQPLLRPLLEAYHQGCRIAFALLNIVARLRRDENILSQQDSNAIPGEYILSILPGRNITVTAIYRLIDAVTMRKEECIAISPAAMNSYFGGAGGRRSYCGTCRLLSNVY